MQPPPDPTPTPDDPPAVERPPLPDGPMTAREAAALIGCSPVSLGNWRRRGCPFERSDKGRFMYSPATVRAWLQAGKPAAKGKEARRASRF